MAISGPTAVRLKTALGSEDSARELITAIDAGGGSGGGGGEGTPPQPLAPTDSPTFADLNLSGVLKVADVQVVGAQQPEVTVPVFTATVGDLPVPDGSTVIADTATPTTAELLDAVVELQITVATLVDTLQTHGVVAPGPAGLMAPEKKRSHHKRLF